MIPNQIVDEHISKLSEAASYIWQREWAERNAGNISIDLTGLQEVISSDKEGKRYIECAMPTEASNMLIFITGTGERLRELINTPEKVACIISIDEVAKGYQIIYTIHENEIHINTHLG
jgi:rhamnulose-1-phosphate aldolase